jgi:hypothetical protein
VVNILAQKARNSFDIANTNLVVRKSLDGCAFQKGNIMKRCNLRLLFEILSFATLFVSGACQPKQSAVFSNDCQVPCWRKITPGQTNFQNAVALIEKFPDFDTTHFSYSGNIVNEPQGIFSNYGVFDLTSGEEVVFWAIDDTVVLIDFSYDPTGDPIGITFGECIKELGEPDLAVQYEVFGDKILYFIPVDGHHTELSVISPSKGFEFDTNTTTTFHITTTF